MPLRYFALVVALIALSSSLAGAAGERLDASLNMAGPPPREGESYLIQSQTKNPGPDAVDVTLGPCGNEPRWLIGVTGPDGQLWALRGHGSAYSPRSPCDADGDRLHVLPGESPTYALNWNLTFADCTSSCTFTNASAGTYELATRTSWCDPCTKAQINVYPANARFSTTLVVVARTWVWVNLTLDTITRAPVDPLPLDLGERCASATYRTNADFNEKGSYGGTEAYLYDASTPVLPELLVFQNYRAGPFPQHTTTTSHALLRVVKGNESGASLSSVRGGELALIRLVAGAPTIDGIPLVVGANITREYHDNVTFLEGQYEITQRVEYANRGIVPVHIEPGGGPCQFLGVDHP